MTNTDTSDNPQPTRSNSDTDGPSNGQQILDEEGTVHEKLKERIIQARDRVDNYENHVFIEATTDPEIQLRPNERVAIWGTSVKQYLRTIEPVLRSDEVTHSNKYYQQVHIGELTLYPPETDGYDFQRAARMNADDTTIRRALDLPPGTDLPQPTNRTFQGLQSIIEAPETLQSQWEVCVNNAGPPPQHDYVYPQTQRTIPKQIYEDAVRHADEFRQQAGVGLDIGVPETDYQELDPF